MKRNREYNEEEEQKHRQNKKKIKNDESQLIIKFKNSDDQEEEIVEERFITPWYRQKTKKIQDPILRMHNQIIDLVNYLAPTQQQHKLRIQAFEFVKRLIEDNIEDVKIESFGSFRTKTYLPNADIDIVAVKQGANQKKIYQKVNNLLEQSEQFSEISYIRGAKVPIIKFVYTKYKIHFDFSVNKLDGLFQLKQVQKSMKIYPEMRYLLFVNKCMLKQRDLSETYSGGVGSFLLFSMILCFLRQCRKEKRNYTLAEYLLKYLEFYGMYNWSDKKIYMKTGQIVHKTPDNVYFSLVSPQDQTHDIGSSAFKIKDVFAVYKNRYRLVTNYNFLKGQSIMKYLVNPSNQIFSFLKENE